MSRSYLGTLAISLCVLSPGAGATSATRLLGAGDQVPGAPDGVVFEELAFPQLEGRWVIAYGYSSIGAGIYAFDGISWRVVADETMIALPGSEPGSVTRIPDLTYDIDASGLVAFAAETNGPSGHRYGVWASNRGNLSAIFMDGEFLPGLPASTFSFGESVWVKAGVVAVETIVIPAPGVPTRDGVVVWSPADGIRFVAALEFGALGNLWLTSEAFWFMAILNQQTGIYEQGLEVGSTPIPVIGPGPAANFVAYTRPVDINGGFAIGGQPFGLSGVFRFVDGQFEKILDSDSPDPHTGLPIGAIDPRLAASGDRVAFKVSRDNGPFLEQLFVQHADRSFERLLAEGEPFEGATVFGISFKAGALDGDRMAVGIDRAGDSAVWIFDLGPEPGTNPLEVPTLGRVALVVLAAGLVVVAIGLLRRRVSL